MRSVLKGLLNALGMVAVLPAVLVYRVNCVVLGPTLAFQGCSQAISLLPGVSGVYLRRAFFRLVLQRCGADASIMFGTIFSHPGIRLGRGVYVGAFCCLGDVDLGDDVLLGSHVSIPNGGRQHGIERLDVPIRMQPGVWPRITIGADSWVGERSTVLADVGAHCVVGAGSVVTRPVPDYAIAVGVPARVIAHRNSPREDGVPCPTPE